MRRLDWLFVGYVALVLLLVSILFASCTTTRIIEHSEDIQRTTDTLRIYKEKLDSIYFRDSVYFREYIKGDTIYSVQYRERTRWRLQKSVDTIYVAKYDTIVKTEYIEKDITKKESFWDKIKYSSIIIFLLIVLVFVFRVNRCLFGKRE